MNNEIYELGQTIGIDKREIDSILTSNPQTLEQPNFSTGPKMYESALYGSISPLDFKY